MNKLLENFLGRLDSESNFRPYWLSGLLSSRMWGRLAAKSVTGFAYGLGASLAAALVYRLISTCSNAL